MDTGFILPGVKWSGRETGHCPLFKTEVKNGRIPIPIPISLHGEHRNSTFPLRVLRFLSDHNKVYARPVTQTYDIECRMH